MRTVTRQLLVDLLKDLAQRTTFSQRCGGGNIGTDHYRHMWFNPSPVVSLSTYSVRHPPGFERLEEAVASALSQFVGEGPDGDRVVYSNIEAIVAHIGFDGTPLTEFCRMLLVAAVLTTPERVVELVGSWSEGQPVPCTFVTVLSGITMEEDELSISPHLSVKKLPSNSEALHEMGVPRSLTGWPFVLPEAPGAVSVYGRTAILRDAAMGPAFFKPNGVADPLTMKRDLLGHTHDPISDRDTLRRSLSLACNAPVEVVCGWQFEREDIRSFSATWAPPEYRPVWWSTRHDRTHTADTLGRLDRESLAAACRLAEELGRRELGVRTSSALGRWIRSLPTSMPNSPSDQFIDLRIAFEQLYAPDATSGDTSFRAQTRCARHLERTLSRRKALANAVKAFYSTASHHAHGRDVAAKHRPRHEQHIQDARNIMRRSLLKIVGDEECADPDLDALSLG